MRFCYARRRIATVRYATEDANFSAATRGEGQPVGDPGGAGAAAQSIVEAAYRSAGEDRAMAVEGYN